MERPSITPEGAELWETSDQGCDIMLRHLEAARDVAHKSQDYTANAEKILQGIPGIIFHQFVFRWVFFSAP